MTENLPDFLEPDDESLSEEGQLNALARGLRMNDSFSVFYAVCNSSQLRDRLMNSLKERLEGLKVLEFRPKETEDNLYLSFGTMQEVGDAKAIFVYGLEDWIPLRKDGQSHPFLLNLNIARNHFPGITTAGVVFWIPQFLLSDIAQAAPDFFSIRSGIFGFAATEAEKTQLTQELTLGGWGEAQALKAGEREERIERLQRLLEELNSIPEESRDWEAVVRVETSLWDNYFAQGLYAQALVVGERLSAMTKRFFGPKNPVTLSALSRLAAIYRAMGRNQEALQLQELTLKIRREELGERHPDTLASLNNLSEYYRAMGRNLEALELQELALKVKRDVLGERHADTLTSQNNLALTYWAMGRKQEALHILELTLKIIREELGERHPDTLASLNNLASAYWSMGRNQEALQLQELTLITIREELGARHPRTLTSQNNLALTYWDIGRHHEAADLMAQALQGAEEVLGPDHPDTILYRKNLADIRSQLPSSEPPPGE